MVLYEEIIWKRHNIKFNKTYHYTCQNQSGLFDLLNDY